MTRKIWASAVGQIHRPKPCRCNINPNQDNSLSMRFRLAQMAGWLAEEKGVRAAISGSTG
jgi:hypothetical protein